MEKIMLKGKLISNLSHWNLDDMKLVDLIQDLTDTYNKYKDQYENIRLSEDEDWSYDERRQIITIVGDRLETNEEFDARVKRELREKELKEKMELAEYNRLREKYANVKIDKKIVKCCETCQCGPKPNNNCKCSFVSFLNCTFDSWVEKTK